MSVRQYESPDGSIYVVIPAVAYMQSALTGRSPGTGARLRIFFNGNSDPVDLLCATLAEAEAEGVALGHAIADYYYRPEHGTTEPPTFPMTRMSRLGSTELSAAWQMERKRKWKLPSSSRSPPATSRRDSA